MGKLGLFFILFIYGMTAVAQTGDSTRVRENFKTGRVYGKVVDNKSNKGLEAASVQVFIVKEDSVGKQSDSLIGGMLSRPNGDFNFDNLPLIDTFKFVISAVGYRPVDMQVFVDPSSSFTERDLGE